MLAVTEPRHQVQLKFWEPLPTLEFGIEAQGCYKAEGGASEKQTKSDN